MCHGGPLLCSQYFPLLQKLVPTLADGSVLILDFANGKVYYNPPSPQLKPLFAFVEDYLGERLEPDGMCGMESGDDHWMALCIPV